jgi:DNA-binding NarL/FixJ family response regulator
MNKTRILVVDDHPFFRSGIAHWLNRQTTLTCCGEADSVATARQAVAALQPDCVLLDLRLGDGDGLDLLRELTQAYPAMRFIAVSQHDEDAYAHRALRVGARGYIMKSEATEKVLEAIETVMSGKVYITRSVSARLMQNLFPDPATTAPMLASLSDRELQVFQLIGVGYSTREIAERLKLSPKTVETYREHLKDKLQLRDSTGLTRAAIVWVETGRFDHR